MTSCTIPMIFNKLANEIHTNNVKFNGQLITPNHFRIIIDQMSMNSLLNIIKNHQFSFFNFNMDGISPFKEFYFQRIDSNRNFLISLVVEGPHDDKGLSLKIKNKIKGFTHFEDYFDSILKRGNS